MKLLIFLLMAMISFNAYADRGAYLIDASGSMGGFKKELKNLIKNAPKDIDVFAFNNKIKPIQRDDEIAFTGGTNLANALTALSKRSFDYVVLISDLATDDDTASLNASRALRSHSLLCVLYIGAGKTPTILDKIADIIISRQDVESGVKQCKILINKKSPYERRPVYKTSDIKQYDF